MKPPCRASDKLAFAAATGREELQTSKLYLRNTKFLMVANIIAADHNLTWRRICMLLLVGNYSVGR
jgi:hypothetical protein